MSSGVEPHTLSCTTDTLSYVVGLGIPTVQASPNAKPRDAFIAPSETLTAQEEHLTEETQVLTSAGLSPCEGPRG